MWIIYPYSHGLFDCHCDFLIVILVHPLVNTLRPTYICGHFADDIFKSIFLNENVLISLKISLKFVPKVRINNILALVQIMARCQTGNKPLCEPVMVSLLMHICVTRPQWVNSFPTGQNVHLFADNIFKCIFFNKMICSLFRISLKFVPKGPIDNKWVLVQVMAWCWVGDKPLSELMLIQFTNAYTALETDELKQNKKHD